MECRIRVDPRICGGQPTITGTRVPVHVVLDLLAAGESLDSVLREYPQLAREDVLAALQYAAALAREEIEPVTPHR